MTLLRQILRLYAQGTGKKRISALTGVSRNTIKKYLHTFASLQITYQDIDQLDDYRLDQLFAPAVPPKQPLPKDERLEQMQRLLPELEKQLRRKGVTRLQLWHQYKKTHPDGYGNSRFNQLIQQYVERSHPTMHLEHKAGDKLFIDFAGHKLSVVDEHTGEVKAVEVFVAILGCSQLTYVEAVASQKQHDLIGACQNALRFIGGVPAAIVPDNLKSAVAKSSRYEPSINEAFAHFAEHYRTSVIPARAYRPKDKALVEGAVKLIYRSIYLKVTEQVHTSLAGLNAAIREALQVHNDTPFKGRDYSRREQFEQLERTALQPLAELPYQMREQAMATVMKNGYVCLRADTHYYSVPYRYIGQKVKLLYTASSVEVYLNYERIALHTRQYSRYKYSTHTEHLASAHRYVSEWTPQKFIKQATAIHADIAMYIAHVLQRKAHPEQAYKSCSGILNLERKVGAERLVGACRRADSYGIYNYPIIVEILAKGLDKFTDQDQPAAEPMPNHSNIRGNEYYQ